MKFALSTDERAKITARFGEEVYEKLLRDLEFYAEKWSLQILSVVDYFSVNCVFVCRSAEHGDAVLKIGDLSFGVSNEPKILHEYDGGRFVRVPRSRRAEQRHSFGAHRAGQPIA